jgi:hypothetical protein
MYDMCPILMSKEDSGPQELQPLIWFWLQNCFKIKILKSISEKKSEFHPSKVLKFLCIFVPHKCSGSNLCVVFHALGSSTSLSTKWYTMVAGLN